MKETLFDLQAPGKKVDRAKKITVKQRTFKITYGAIYVLVEEVGRVTMDGVGMRGERERCLQSFQLLTEAVEGHARGESYAIREEIIRRLAE